MGPETIFASSCCHCVLLSFIAHKSLLGCRWVVSRGIKRLAGLFGTFGCVVVPYGNKQSVESSLATWSIKGHEKSFTSLIRRLSANEGEGVKKPHGNWLLPWV
ncbi:hypothetical protein CEXT_567851 [Caerostris extrusa]|uniref:Uncharacterized protein n=1 Tax=Caerostris extrusa TaxID=172846 RepID=A0AAV4TR06_CAEEX|nr:hypothetical protein CEXT_567851 [Caerostris extrusa]